MYARGMSKQINSKKLSTQMKYFGTFDVMAFTVEFCGIQLNVLDRNKLKCKFVKNFDLYSLNSENGFLFAFHILTIYFANCYIQI